MNDADRLKALQDDQHRAGTLLYLEGPTDVALFFALLGIRRPSSDIHQDVYVKGLNGVKDVRSCTRVAAANKLTRVFGIIDGDGLDLTQLQPLFDAPHLGPLFSWKGYCIENIAAQAAWPAAWGAMPNLAIYAPYVAFNTVQDELSKTFKKLRFIQFDRPKANVELATEADLRNVLTNKQAAMNAVDVKHLYNQALGAYLNLQSAAEIHTKLNGKWLVEHHACEVTGASIQVCREAWVNVITAAGGHSEVRAWWQRVMGQAP